MAIPDFQSIMLPLMQIFADEKEHSIQDFLPELAKYFDLSDQELGEMIPSGRQTTFYNRVGWARTYLSRAGLVELTRRSFYKITNRGKDVLATNPKRIDIKLLLKFPEFVSFRERDGGRKRGQETPTSGNHTIISTKSPQEELEDAFEEIRASLAEDLLSFVKNSTPQFFERLVIELLVKMGYGGSLKESAKVVGQPGDEGIDGVIDEDRLGLDSIYIQAKKWENGVGRPEIQKFVGALAGKKANKGIFITTSSFTEEARKYVSTIGQRVVLIDGLRLTELMIEFDVGVSLVNSYPIKKVDTDFFEQ